MRLRLRPEERTYSGDLVLLALFVILAVVVAGCSCYMPQVD